MALTIDGSDPTGDLGDLLDAKLTTPGAWTAYTPTLTNLTLGNGTLDFKYTQIGKFVHVRGSFILGSTSAVSGSARFSLPVTAVSVSNRFVVGYAGMLDSGTEQYYGPIAFVNTTTIELRRWNVSGANLLTAALSSTTPFTWTTNDGMFIYFSYEAA